MSRSWMIAVFTCLTVMVVAQQQPLFTSGDQSQVMRYWAEPGRYSVSLPPDSAQNGVWQVRLTSSGSKWLWNYDKSRGIKKGPPGTTPSPQNAEQKGWDDWISAKVAYDRWQASELAKSLNAALSGRAPSQSNDLLLPPPIPGPAPKGLIDLNGNPPLFATAVTPLQHTISFEDGTSYTLLDNVRMKPNYRYYRFEQGVMSVGTPVKSIPKDELDGLFHDAGLTPFEQKVFTAVSILEGGFDSVNTYDTGFVSVGFIQFAAREAGAGSLGSKLIRYKTDSPTEFAQDFHRFGIDVKQTGELVVLDPATGVEISGSEAGMKVIDDRRLIAVFQHAGATSRPYKIAQLRTARDQYFPASDVITVNLAGQSAQVKVEDVVKSEAGMATLMDRKVNTGKLDPLTDVINRLIKDKTITSPNDLANYEREIISSVKYRKDYLQDLTLTQPGSGH